MRKGSVPPPLLNRGQGEEEGADSFICSPPPPYTTFPQGPNSAEGIVIHRETVFSQQCLLPNVL